MRRFPGDAASITLPAIHIPATTEPQETPSTGMATHRHISISHPDFLVLQRNSDVHATTPYACPAASHTIIPCTPQPASTRYAAQSQTEFPRSTPEPGLTSGGKMCPVSCVRTTELKRHQSQRHGLPEILHSSEDLLRTFVMSRCPVNERHPLIIFPVACD